MPAGWYDAVYESSDEYRRHYTESVYYPLWAVVIDRIRRHHPTAILEVGCGSGQLAQAIIENLPRVRYHGFDVSKVAIAMAQANQLALSFSVDDALTTRLFETAPYDIVLATEFLEHIEQDREVLQKIRRGARVLATVPGFPATAHVRHFTGAAGIIERYGDLLEGLEVTSLLLNRGRARMYLIDGMKR